jgi:hypothetical protein
MAWLDGRQAKKRAQVLQSNGCCHGVGPEAELSGSQRREDAVLVRGYQGLLAPPLILLVILLTSNHKVMGKRVNPPLLRYLGWATIGIMTAAGRE